MALAISKAPIAELISYTRHYVTSMSGNAHFPKPYPDLASVTIQVDQLEADYNTSLTRVLGAADKMRAEQKKLLILLMGLAIYVETVANLDPDHALDIIDSAGMRVKKSPIRKKRTFEAALGVLKGTVKLINQTASRGTYIYQMSTNPNMQGSWVQIYAGRNVRFAITGLISAKRYFFRGAISSKGVQGDWSTAIDVVSQ